MGKTFYVDWVMTELTSGKEIKRGSQTCNTNSLRTLIGPGINGSTIDLLRKGQEVVHESKAMNQKSVYTPRFQPKENEV